MLVNEYYLSYYLMTLNIITAPNEKVSMPENIAYFEKKCILVVDICIHHLRKRNPHSDIYKIKQ